MATHQTSSVTQPAVASPFMPAREVAGFVGLGLSTLYRWADSGLFPSPIDLSSPRRNGRRGKSMWVRADVEAWIEDRITRARPQEAAQQPA